AQFPRAGGADSIVCGLGDRSPMLHWHVDTVDLPQLPAPANPPPPPAPPPRTGSALISSTRTCKNQAFRFKNRLFGFQYHFEMTAEQIAQIVASAGEDVKRAGGEALARISGETEKFYPRYQRLGDRIIRNFVQYLKV